MRKFTWRDWLLICVTSFVVVVVCELISFSLSGWVEGNAGNLASHIFLWMIFAVAIYFLLGFVVMGVGVVLRFVEGGGEIDTVELIRHVFATTLVIAVAVFFVVGYLRYR